MIFCNFPIWCLSTPIDSIGGPSSTIPHHTTNCQVANPRKLLFCRAVKGGECVRGRKGELERKRLRVNGVRDEEDGNDDDYAEQQPKNCRNIHNALRGIGGGKVLPMKRKP